VADLDPIVQHFDATLRAFGATARGADHRDEASQAHRFEQLDRLALEPGVSSVCDLGCGWGAYAGHLRSRGYEGAYVGIDVTPAMVDRARVLFPGERFTVGHAPADADAVVASGTFNVRAGDDESWARMVRSTIAAMFDAARVGIAFNMLSRVVSPHLFAVDPETLASWLEPLCAAGATIEHDVGLAELFVLVRRS
jgi:SAM-dependent methyltransferase